MEIQKIKQSLSILRVLQQYGLTPDRNKRINCPFHDDKTPSMQVYPETNTVFCFSSNCKLNGKAIDQINFIMHKEQITKHQAILKAKELLNVSPNLGGANEKLKMKNEELGAKRNTELLTKVFSIFHNSIKIKTNKGRNYLQSRNIDVDKLKQHGILTGYNSGEFHSKGRLTNEEIKQCEENGLIIKKSAQKRDTYAKGCVIFPLLNANNEITGLYGRRTESAGNNNHYYLKNRKGLYPAYPPEDTKILMLTESIIDAATLLVVSDKCLVISEKTSV